MLQLVCNKACTLKEFTDENYAQGSFFWSYLTKNKEIKVNGKKVSGDILLAVGDVVAYYLTPKQAEKTAFTILYEDENVCVVDKESGVNSEAVFAELIRKGESYFIHRLDRNTRGLMVFAKTKESEKMLLNAFKERKIEKIYHALCVGRLALRVATLTAYLKKDENSATVKVFATPRKGAETIITEYSVLEEFDSFSKVEITLHTGKTHQIRAHFAFLGNPVLGDMKYGDGEANKKYNVARQCLVAKKMRFHLDGALAYLNEKTFVSTYNAVLE